MFDFPSIATMCSWCIMHIDDMKRISRVLMFLILTLALGRSMAQQTTDAYLTLMRRAREHATSHKAKNLPVLSPVDSSVLGAYALVHVNALHTEGFKVVPWTTNDPDKMRALIALGVDGIISDRPDRKST